MFTFIILFEKPFVAFMRLIYSMTTRRNFLIIKAYRFSCTIVFSYKITFHIALNNWLRASSYLAIMYLLWSCDI